MRPPFRLFLGVIVGRSQIQRDAALQRQPEQVVGGPGHIGTGGFLRHETAFDGPAFADVVGRPFLLAARVFQFEQAGHVDVLAQVSDGRVGFTEVGDRVAADQHLESARQFRREHQTGTVAQFDVARQKNRLEMFGVTRSSRNADHLQNYEKNL